MIKDDLTVRLETYIAAPIEKIWNYVATEDGLKKWLGPKTFEPKVGGRIIFDVAEGPDSRFILSGEVKTLETNKKLSFTWLEEEVGVGKWPTETLVTIALAPFHHGTRVTITHSGFDRLPSDIILKAFSDHLAGWTGSHYPLASLRELVMA